MIMIIIFICLIRTTISGEQLPPPQLPNPLNRVGRDNVPDASSDHDKPSSQPLKDIKIGVFWEVRDCLLGKRMLRDGVTIKPFISF
jgi:hypothetical protein